MICNSRATSATGRPVVTTNCTASALNCGLNFRRFWDTNTSSQSRGPVQDPWYTSNLGGVRQWIESVNQTLKGQLGLEQHGGRTPAGVFTRVAQRLLAMAATIWHNWNTNTARKRSLIAYDH